MNQATKLGPSGSNLLGPTWFFFSLSLRKGVQSVRCSLGQLRLDVFARVRPLGEGGGADPPVLHPGLVEVRVGALHSIL